MGVRALLSLVDVVAAYGVLKEDLVGRGLALCDDFGFLCVIVEVAGAEGRAAVFPLEVDELVHLRFTRLKGKSWDVAREAHLDAAKVCDVVNLLGLARVL